MSFKQGFAILNSNEGFSEEIFSKLLSEPGESLTSGET
jgi:hypothetical protein